VCQKAAQNLSLARARARAEKAFLSLKSILGLSAAALFRARKHGRACV
jgi:hypothetical protein